MATRKSADGDGTAGGTSQSGTYTVLRDYAGGNEGDTVTLPADEAADLVRDGMIAPAEREDG